MSVYSANGHLSGTKGGSAGAEMAVYAGVVVVALTEVGPVVMW